MDSPWGKDVRFERCPKCGAVVMFTKDSDVSVCNKCGSKIKLHKGVVVK